MTPLKDLERELKEHWKRTKEERKQTHTSALYKKALKNNN